MPQGAPASASQRLKLQAVTKAPGFYRGPGTLKADPHICATSSWSTESAPLLPFKFLLGEKKSKIPTVEIKNAKSSRESGKIGTKYLPALAVASHLMLPQWLLHVSWRYCCFHGLFVLVLTLPPYRRGYLFLVPQPPRYQKLCNRFPTMSYLNTLDQLLTNQNK